MSARLGSPHPSGPLQVRGSVRANEPAGAYRLLTIAAPGIPGRVLPGQFVAIAVGGENSSMLGRRAFSVYDTVQGEQGTGQRTPSVTRTSETVLGTSARESGTPDSVAGPPPGETEALRIVFAVHGDGTAWLAGLRPGQPLDIVGPLGRPFTLPSGSELAEFDSRALLAADSPSRRDEAPPREGASQKSSARRHVLVGGGYGAAPLLSLADLLLSHGHDVHLVLGAATADRVFGVDRARRSAASTTVTTEDGSLGLHGIVTDVLPDLLDAREGRGPQGTSHTDGRTKSPEGSAEGGGEDSPAVYACGPMPMLRAVTAVAAERGASTQVAVEETMACGIGVCMTCVLPVVGDDGLTRMTRSCLEGPVFPGEAVRWDDIGTVPADAWGARP